MVFVQSDVVYRNECVMFVFHIETKQNRRTNIKQTKVYQQSANMEKKSS